MLSKERIDELRGWAECDHEFDSTVVLALLDHIDELEEDTAAMSRICAGMTLEEMQNAAFTYQSLVEIVQRRDVRDKKKDHAFDCGLKHGWNNCLEMISKMGEQK